MTASEYQITEHRTAVTINAGNLTVENGAFDPEIFREPNRQLRKAVEDVSVSRNQFGLAGLNMRQGTETIDLQFEDMIVGINGSVVRESGIGRRFRGSTRGLYRRSRCLRWTGTRRHKYDYADTHPVTEI